jgi:hypothetical protein
MDALLTILAVSLLVSVTVGFMLAERYLAVPRRTHVMKFRTVNRVITVEMRADSDSQRAADWWVSEHRAEINEQNCWETCHALMEAVPGVVAVECWRGCGTSGSILRTAGVFR